MAERKILIETEKSTLFVIENFTPNYFDELANIKTLLLYEPEITVRGKKCNQRRNVGFFSNNNVGYQYSGQLMKSQKLEDSILTDTLTKVNSTLGTKFNGVLVNEYIDGTKTVGPHSDDERGLDKHTLCVAGIAYGAVRKFRIRNKETGKIVLDHDHQPCELLVMQGNFQKEFTHEIPQQKKVKDVRISLTFRHHTK